MKNKIVNLEVLKVLNKIDRGRNKPCAISKITIGIFTYSYGLKLIRYLESRGIITVEDRDKRSLQAVLTKNGKLILNNLNEVDRLLK